MGPKAMSRADFYTAIVLIALALAVLVGSITMDRLETRNIHPASVPGLVPGLLGIALLFCGTMLMLRSIRAGGHRPLPSGANLPDWLRGIEARRLALTAVVSIVYAVLLVGWLPYQLATALYVFVMVVGFERLMQAGRPSWRHTLAVAVVLAGVAGFGVGYVFEELFLVRLP